MIKKKKVADKIKYSHEVTQRFLQEADEIIGRKNDKGVKVTQEMFSKSVGIMSSGLARLRNSLVNVVTLEQCLLLHKKYGTSIEWLMLGGPAPVNSLEQRIAILEKSLTKSLNGQKTKTLK